MGVAVGCGLAKTGRWGGGGGYASGGDIVIAIMFGGGGGDCHAMVAEDNGTAMTGITGG